MNAAANTRLMSAADLPAAMALKQAAGWNQTEQDWRLLLSLQPEGCFVLEADGQVVASATAYCYGQQLAWIGMVLTLPEFRGRGFGSRVFTAAVDFCRQRSIRCVKLDATAMGQPLYERAGFLPEYEVERWGGLPQPARLRENGTPVVALTESRLHALVPADTAAFGTPRASLLCALWRNAEWAGCIEGEGAPAAYGMARSGVNALYFGPCIASRAGDASALLREYCLRHAGKPIFVDVPAPNAEARRLLAAGGLEVRRTLVRMYLGSNDCPGDPSRLFGLAGFEYG